MKKWSGIILVVAFTIFAIVDAIHDFVSSDGLHYFSEQPHRLIFVAAIGIVGGLGTLGFMALSPRLQRGIKLLVLGAGASLVMVGGGYLTYLVFQLAKLPPHIDPAIPRHMAWHVVLVTAALAGLLWCEFYRVWGNRDRVA